MMIPEGVYNLQSECNKILEVGTGTTSSSWNSLYFSTDYSNIPTVVAMVLSENETHPVVVRLNDITTSKFDALV